MTSRHHTVKGVLLVPQGVGAGMPGRPGRLPRPELIERVALALKPAFQVKQ